VKERWHATRVIAKHQIIEVLIGPAFYVALTVGLLITHFLINGFMRAVDPSGFNYQLTPLYSAIGRLLESVFGRTFAGNVFSEGPFSFAFVASLVPVFLFLAISTVFKFGLEKSSGAIELIVYGPADGTSYVAACFLKDLCLTLVTMVILVIYMAGSAAFNNLLLGQSFLAETAIAFGITLAMYSYGMLASTIASNSASALALFMGIGLLFLLMFFGSFALVSGYPRDFAAVVGWIVQWFSPFYYGNLCVQGAEMGSPVVFGGGLLLLLILTGTMLLMSHLVIERRGVRA
jgi:hypothetical protein